MTDSASDARQYALKLLGYRERSEKELRERLGQRGFHQVVIDATLSYLKKACFVDDKALAADLKRQAFEQRLLGHRGAKSFMLKRGLPQSLVESTLDYDEEAELENAVRFLNKKKIAMGRYTGEEKKRKLWSLLARRGYAPGVIVKAMRTVNFYEEV